VNRILTALCLATAAFVVSAAETPDSRVRTYVDPVRIVASSKDCSFILAPRYGQTSEGPFLASEAPMLDATNDFVLVDFGRELHGGVAIGCGARTGCEALRITFGESVGEAMSVIGEKGAQQNHALRDIVIPAPWCGTLEFGNTGFRFVKLQLPRGGALQLESLRAVSLMRPMKASGSFRCSDPRLTEVWNTAARTVHLCCQNYLWDGIKRDRLVWQGDMHPEVSSVLAVYGSDPVIRESLDYMAATTPVEKWMNGMPSYTLWWILCLHDYWFQSGDTSYLAQHKDYFEATLRRLNGIVKEDGSWAFEGSWCPGGFLDWPTQHNPAGVKAGMQGLWVLAYEAAVEMERALGADEGAARATLRRLRKISPDPAGAKSAAALLALAGNRAPREMYERTLAPGGVKGFSTFYGYYMLEAMSEADETPAAIRCCRDYWGAMLDMGATSFWEDFDVAWTNGVTRLDEMPVEGKKDIHGDFGDFCYVGYRHSLCHGWSSGPAAWLIHRVLGIRPVEPGCKAVVIDPQLGDLTWAEGSLATPLGPVYVRAERKTDGFLDITVSLPEGVRRVPVDSVCPHRRNLLQ